MTDPLSEADAALRECQNALGYALAFITDIDARRRILSALKVVRDARASLTSREAGGVELPAEHRDSLPRMMDEALTLLGAVKSGLDRLIPPRASSSVAAPAVAPSAPCPSVAEVERVYAQPSTASALQQVPLKEGACAVCYGQPWYHVFMCRECYANRIQPEGSQWTVAPSPPPDRCPTCGSEARSSLGDACAFPTVSQRDRWHDAPVPPVEATRGEALPSEVEDAVSEFGRLCAARANREMSAWDAQVNAARARLVALYASPRALPSVEEVARVIYDECNPRGQLPTYDEAVRAGEIEGSPWLVVTNARNAATRVLARLGRAS